jgi:hypothetical protein
MIDYEGQIRITVHGAPQWVWVSIVPCTLLTAAAWSVVMPFGVAVVSSCDTVQLRQFQCHIGHA